MAWHNITQRTLALTMCFMHTQKTRSWKGQIISSAINIFISSISHLSVHHQRTSIPTSSSCVTSLKKWAEAYPVPDHTALTVADKIVNEFKSRFRVPLEIHTDQGREFESQLLSRLCETLQIMKTRTCPYRPPIRLPG